MPRLPESSGTKSAPVSGAAPGSGPALGIDRTAKLYIGGKQTRPDSGYSIPIAAANGDHLGEVPLGNRKDIRDAVEAARKAQAWEQSDGHSRAQILYFIAENLEQRSDEFSSRLQRMTGGTSKSAAKEVHTSIERIFSAAAWADKYEGAVHNPPGRKLTLALQEPMGVIGIICPDDTPLLAFISLVAHAIAAGNRVVTVPSASYPLIATDFYQILETSDVPAGVVNIVTGRPDELSPVLSAHAGVEALWYFGPISGMAATKAESVSNMKRVWTHEGRAFDWYDPRQGQGRELLKQATQVKNVWVPYGE
ncbi:aldehyde dehydrogenase family protein [Fodinicurvata halophila]|uniref:aldehyde dehydrogenase family protein n=1 Tax=Fodinicurvata halophila TaxID=1419723 RepID=UPI00363D84E1